MKRKNAFLFLLAVMLHSIAYATESPVWWGYWNTTITPHIIDTPVQGTVDFGFRLTPGNGQFSDSRLHGIRFCISDKTAVTQVKVWASVRKFAWGTTDPDLLVKEVSLSDLCDMTHDGNPTEVIFDEPIDILPSENKYANLYVGVFIRTEDGKAPCHIMTAQNGESPLNSCLIDWRNYESAYGAVAMQILVSNDRWPAQSAYVEQGDALFMKVGSTQVLTPIFVNDGTQAIKSVDYCVMIDGQPQAEQHAELPAAIEELGVRFSLPVTMEVPSEARQYGCGIQITKVNGQDYLCPREMAYNTLTALTQMGVKRTVMEEFTGTWCPNCPRGMVGMQLLEDRFGDRFVGIAVHDDDPMEVASYNESSFVRGVVLQMGGRPSCSVDRSIACDPYGGLGLPYHFGADAVVDSALAIPTPADIELTSAWTTGDPETASVACDVKTTFHYSADDAPYALLLVLTADSLIGNTQEWLQVNTLVGKTEYDEDLNEFIYGERRMRLKYNHVAIDVAGPENGIEGSIKAPLVADEPQHYRHTFQTAGNVLVQNPTLLHAVAMLIDTRTGVIINVAKSHVDGGEVLGIRDNRLDSIREESPIYTIDGRRSSKHQHGIVIENRLKIMRN